MKNGWLALLILVMACGSPPNGPKTAGTGSKAGNAFKIKGAVVYYAPLGDTLSTGNMQVTVYKIVPQAAGGFDWYPVTSGCTDTSGAFEFDSLQTGEYSLIAKNRDSTYMAFSGYIDLPRQDAVRDMDTLVLAPTLSIMGMFQYTTVNNIQVSLVGTASQAAIQCDTTMLLQPRRYFVFDNVPLGDYRMKVALNNGQSQEKDFYISLPTAVVLAADSMYDTSYTDTSCGQTGSVRITEKMFTETNSYFEIVCFLVKNQTAPPAVSKNARSTGSAFSIKINKFMAQPVIKHKFRQRGGL